MANERKQVNLDSICVGCGKEIKKGSWAYWWNKPFCSSECLTEVREEEMYEDLSREKRLETIRRMKSIGKHTVNKYPTISEFYKALHEERVTGDYEEKIIIENPDPLKSYVFTK